MPDETKHSSGNTGRKTAGFLVMGFVMALWIFVVFFLDGIIGNLIRERLVDMVSTSTHGEYRLSFTDFRYHRGTIDADGLLLARVGYRVSERGTTLRQLHIDSTEVTGVNLWDALIGKPLNLSTLSTNDPRIFLCSFSQGKKEWRLLPDTVKASNNSPGHVTVNIREIRFPNVLLFGKEGDAEKESGTFSFEGNGLRYGSKSLNPLLFDRFDLSVPWIHYQDSNTSCYVHSATLSSTNSMVSIDTFSYLNKTSDAAFRGSGIQTTGLDFIKTFNSEGSSLHTISARTWAAQFSIPKRNSTKSVDSLSWQERLSKSVHFPLRIDSVMLNRGDMTIHLDSAHSVAAQDFDLYATNFDLDSGRAAEKPLFSDRFSVSAAEASYTANRESVRVRSLQSAIQDSLITASDIFFSTDGTTVGKKAPIAVHEVRAEGIRFTELLAGTAVEMASLRAHKWNVTGLPAMANHTKIKHSNAQKSIWAIQKNIALSISIPVRIGTMNLENGSVHVRGASSPTIDANNAALGAVNFDVDTTSSTALFFSKDFHVDAGTFHFADAQRHNIVDATNARTRLGGRSLSATHIRYLSRSPFEPEINNTAYAAHDLDLRGIDFAGLLDGKQISVADATATSWEIERKADTVSNPEKPVEKEEKPAWSMPIRVGSVRLKNGTVQFFVRDTLPEEFSKSLTSDITKLDVTRFRFLPPHKKRPRLGFDQVVCQIPTFRYDPRDGFYRAEIRNLHANFHDSIVTMDSLGYVPKYSEDEFSALHTYSRGRTDFRLANVQIVGIDARRMINGGGVVMDSFVAPTLWLDYFKDDRKPSNPNPGPAVMPNDIISKLNLPFTVQDISIRNGHIQIRELDKTEDSSGYFTFDSVRIAASPITLDSTSPEIDTPTRIEMDGIFIAESPTHIAMVYPLHDSTLNLAVKGTVGPFDLKQLNSYLVPSERVQVMNGNFYHADVDMTIHNDVATTYVSPIYNHFKLRVLPPDPHDKRDFEEGVKTFIANSFILRDDDPDEKGGPPITATTTLARKPDEEYFQFLWFAIRQSLGKVVGGFK